MPEILTAAKSSILSITLNRPEKRNALNDALITDLKNVLRQTDEDETLRAIVIRWIGMGKFLKETMRSVLLAILL